MAAMHRTVRFLVCLLPALYLSTYTADADQTGWEEQTASPAHFIDPSAPLYKDDWHPTSSQHGDIASTPALLGTEPSSKASGASYPADQRGSWEAAGSKSPDHLPDVIPPVFPTKVADSTFHTSYDGGSRESGQGGQPLSSLPSRYDRDGSETSFNDEHSFWRRYETSHFGPDGQIPTTPTSHLKTTAVMDSGATYIDSYVPDGETPFHADYTSRGYLQSISHFQASRVSSLHDATTGSPIRDSLNTSITDHRHEMESSIRVYGQTGVSSRASEQIFPTSTIAVETSTLHSTEDYAFSKSGIYSWLYQSNQLMSSFRTRRPSTDHVLLPSSMQPQAQPESSTVLATPHWTEVSVQHLAPLSSEQLFPTSAMESQPFLTRPASHFHASSSQESGQHSSVFTTVAAMSSSDHSPFTVAGVKESSVLSSQHMEGSYSSFWPSPYLPSVHWPVSSASESWAEKALSSQPFHVLSSLSAAETSFIDKGLQTEAVSPAETKTSAMPPDLTSSSAPASISPSQSERSFSTATFVWPPVPPPEETTTSKLHSSEVAFPSTATSQSFPFVPDVSSSSEPATDGSPGETPKIHYSAVPTEKEMPTTTPTVPMWAPTKTTTATTAWSTATLVVETPKTTRTPSPSPSPPPHTVHVTPTTTHHPVGRSYCHYLISFDGNCHLVMNNTVRLAEFVGALLTELTRELGISGSRIKPHDLQCKPTRIYVSLENMHCPSTGIRIRQMILSRRLVLPVVLDGRLATFTASDVRQVDLPSSGVGSIDVPSVAIDNVDIIVIIVACSVCAILIVLCAIMGFRECYRRKYAQSFDLVDIPHVNLKMEDFTLTRIPRPKTIYEDNSTVRTLRKSPVPEDHGYSNGNSELGGGGGGGGGEVQVRMQPINEGLVIGITGYPDCQNGEAAPLQHRRHGSASSGSATSMANARSPSTERLLEMEGEQAAGGGGASNPNFQSDETPTHSANPVF